MSTLKEALNRTNPGTLADALRALQIGSLIRALPYNLFGVAPATGNPNVGLTNPALTLPDDAKAASVGEVYARAGTGTLGPLVADPATPPAAGKYFIAPNGDIVFAIADAWTSLDVKVVPLVGDVVELVLPVAANVATILDQYAALTLLEAEALVGASIGKKVIDAPGTAVAAGHGAFSLDKLTVTFNAADAVTSCRVKFLAKPAVVVGTALQSATPPII